MPTESVLGVTAQRERALTSSTTLTVAPAPVSVPALAVLDTPDAELKPVLTSIDGRSPRARAPENVTTQRTPNCSRGSTEFWSSSTRETSTPPMVGTASSAARISSAEDVA